MTNAQQQATAVAVRRVDLTTIADGGTTRGVLVAVMAEDLDALERDYHRLREAVGGLLDELGIETWVGYWTLNRQAALLALKREYAALLPTTDDWDEINANAARREGGT